MAKIISVELLEIPDKITVGLNNTDITVLTTIDFHEMDIKGNVEYCLHLFVYDIHGKIDPPLIISNWDESYVISIQSSLDRRDDFLGQTKVMFKACELQIAIVTPMVLKLGSLSQKGIYLTRQLEIFATATPAVGRISKWSIPYETQVYH
ncbi:hypothetical protein ES711_11450 [Gelidibacter salicanalis]|uniref:Uncharacterized protein n=1 Tax=Gelidibacter salicanalis TaxID=291193 RepID=A0A5C7ALB8_9FLAO|nr:hypothetical protein [Gelidibacter salicanalis]TXE07375.1 hypothetical protein ES711_11450 [Gelidibacter salicanalis]